MKISKLSNSPKIIKNEEIEIILPTTGTDLMILNNPPQLTIDDISEPTSGNDTPIDGNPSPDQPEPEKIIRLIEMTGTNGKTFKIIHPDDLEPDMDKTPSSKRMGELLLIQMDEGTRTSGDHPSIKKHPKWMINPTLNGKERWMDLTKEIGWNLKERMIILTRNQTNFKEMNSHIIGRMIISE